MGYKNLEGENKCPKATEPENWSAELSLVNLWAIYARGYYLKV